jgi:hypothetical protein
MPHNRSHKPIDTPPLEMHGRARPRHVVWQEAKALRRRSETDVTKPIQNGRNSSLEMFKEFFTNPRTGL